MSNFNSNENFQKGILKGNCLQDLNNYRCPDCGSPFFFRGRQDYMDYVQCVKENCLRVDLLPTHNQIVSGIKNLKPGESITFAL